MTNIYARAESTRGERGDRLHLELSQVLCCNGALLLLPLSSDRLLAWNWWLRFRHEVVVIYEALVFRDQLWRGREEKDRVVTVPIGFSDFGLVQVSHLYGLLHLDFRNPSMVFAYPDEELGRDSID